MHAEKARLYLEQKQADPTQRGTYNATASDTLMRRASTETTQQQQQQQPDEQYGRRLQGRDPRWQSLRRGYVKCRSTIVEGEAGVPQLWTYNCVAPNFSSNPS